MNWLYKAGAGITQVYDTGKCEATGMRSGLGRGCTPRPRATPAAGRVRDEIRRADPPARHRPVY